MCKYRTVTCAVILALIITGCSSAGQKDVFFEPGIERQPEPQSVTYNEPMQQLPEFNPSVQLRPNLRGADLTGLDLAGAQETLLNSGFSTTTLWPDTLPEGFNPEHILDLNKNPGFNIRSLHEQGITGAGVGVAIIDYVLLVEHVEYKDTLEMYREINFQDARAEFHGPSMASILAGESVGVAPGARLYFVAVRNMDPGKNDVIHNQEYTAQAVQGIIRLNKTLPEKEKIRVISISQWWSPHTKGYKSMVKAVEEAREAGIFVVSCNLWQFDNRFHIHGLLKDALADPDDFESYYPAPWDHWIAAVNRNGHGDFYLEEFTAIKSKQVVMIPSGFTTSAGAAHNEDYIFTPLVNWSNTIPYIAGLYALACQVKPDVTPELFWEAAYHTGLSRQVERGDGSHDGRIVNPLKLIEYLRNS